ncbi:hypothetical protein KY349_05510 [Candidatus Woesearchaeota archaeon]|nr:hypothetical protein [Candidatus Woesearchaeota archaeon]
MELSTVVGIIVIIVVAVLIMKFLGKLVSFLLSVVGIILVVWLVIVGLRYLDEQNVRDNLMNSNSMFVLQDGDSMVTGFATQDVGEADVSGLENELDNPNSNIYDDYYKVIVVNADALPEKTAMLFDVADDEDKLKLFKSYVDNNLLEGDFVESLVEKEEQGDVEVYKETLAFRHGIKDVLSS